jgi:OOP family OmpA-OmpF porin
MKKLVAALATVTAALLSGGAHAQAYVGGAVGQSHINLDCSGVPNCETTDTGFKFFGGFKFTPNIAGEVTYFDWGKAGGSASGSGGTAEATVSGTGVGVGAAFFADFTPQWSGVARLGIASNKAKGEARLNGSMIASESESKTTAYAGLGVSYALSKQVKLDGAIDFSNLELQGEKGNVRLFSIGLTYAF